MSQVKKKLLVDSAVISHKGCVRFNNEDNFFFDGDMLRPAEADQGVRLTFKGARKAHLFAVCDGMGGLEGGEKASCLAAHELISLMKYIPQNEWPACVRQYAIHATELIRQDTVKSKSERPEGTTLAMVYLSDARAHIANVGDSRVYWMRQRKLTQVSRDHSAVHTSMLHGQLTREQARKHPASNVIDRYLGMPKEKITDNFAFQRSIELCREDRFLICSDGLSDLMPHEMLENLAALREPPMAVAEQLVTKALEWGGKDNVTVIVGDLLDTRLPGPEGSPLVSVQELIKADLETTA